ncbi:hypothetical protein MJD09_20050 [bacterium]|nr:hypothetical protein [bacterium]
MKPELLTDEKQLERFMAEPHADLVAAVAKMQVDLMVIGAGGKMGPTLTRLAQAAVVKAGADMHVFPVTRFLNEFINRHSLW